ncbi:MAG TPA: hypothetical protein VLQ52_01490 [Coriobacteriia bacterium]|nr:hypothetical protein [Coriobacteriia bacterium]
MKRLLIGALVIVLALGLAGCKSVSDKIGEEIGEEIVGGAIGGDVEVDDDQVTIETDEGETTIAGGEGVLVDEFPRDFPLYDGASVVTSTYFGAADGRDQVYAMLSTGDGVDEVYEWYKAELQTGGWSLTNDVDMSTGDSELAQLAAESGTREAAVMVSEGSEGTEIVINVYTEK